MNISVEEVQAKIQEAIKAAKGLERSRAASVVVTKLEEAELWLTKVGE